MNIALRFSSWRTTLVTFLRIAVGAALLAWALWQLDWAALAQALRRIQPIWIVAALISFLLSLALKLFRWRWLLKQLVPRIGWLTLARALFLGQAVNIVGLGRWGEVARVMWLRQESGISGVGLATSVVAEKLLDVVGLGVAGLWWLFLLFAPSTGVNITRFVLLTSVSALALGLFAWWGQPILTWLYQRFAAWRSPIGQWLAPRVASMADGLAGLTQHHLLGRGLLLTALIWGVMMLTNFLLLPALALPFSGLMALSVLVVGHLGVVANLTPANIGPAHWAITVALTLVGAAQSTALAYAFVMHAIVTLTPLAITLLLNGWYWPDRKTLANAPAAPSLPK